MGIPRGSTGEMHRLPIQSSGSRLVAACESLAAPYFTFYARCGHSIASCADGSTIDGAA